MLKQLRDIYEWCIIKHHSSGNYDKTEWEKMTPDERSSLRTLYDHMRNLGLITYHLALGRPILISLTPKGTDYLFNPSAPTQAPMINIGSIGTNIGGVSSTIQTININYGLSFLELKTLISQHTDVPSSEKLLKAVENLEEIISANKPLPKGLLSSINDYMEHHSWISSPLASIIIQYLTK